MTLAGFLERFVEALAILLACGAVWLAYRAYREARAAAGVANRGAATYSTRAAQSALAAEMEALRSDGWKLERRIDQLAREVERLGSLDRDPSSEDRAVSVGERSEVTEAVLDEVELSQEPVPSGRPVEFDGEDLRLSRSLSALGSLVVSDGGESGASVFLNDQIQIDHVAYERWSTLFELRGGGPYARYRTVKPAAVEWNEEAGRGRLVSRGVAEVLP
jgi:hypothetical protein